ncbi:hypothetical protein [Pseudomonas sp. SDO5591_S426]
MATPPLIHDGEKPVLDIYRFFDETVAYGGLELATAHYSCFRPGRDDYPVGFEFFEDTPDWVVEGIMAVYEAHDPTPPGQTEPL